MSCMIFGSEMVDHYRWMYGSFLQEKAVRWKFSGYQKDVNI